MEENTSAGGSQDLGSSASLESAVSSISTEAPKLTGLDKLRAAKDHVEKTGEVPKASSVAATQVTAKPDVAAPAAKVVPTMADGTPIPYAPDFKYKASGKELEIPEKFRSLITDKESEEEVKKLFGQVGTLDEFRTKNSELIKNLGVSSQEVARFKAGIQTLGKAHAKGDYDAFFKGMNIPQENIFKWVLDKVNYNQLAPEAKAQIDAQRNLQYQNELAQEQVGQGSQRELQLATQMKGMQLDITLGKADVKSMADAFDARVGRPNAFKDAIINHGMSVHALSGGRVDLTPEQAVQDFVQKYGNPSAFAPPKPAAGAATVVEPTQAANTPNAQPTVKVIPNVSGRGAASPIKQKPRNLEDLKRLRDEAVKADNASRSPSQGYLAG